MASVQDDALLHFDPLHQSLTMAKAPVVRRFFRSIVMTGHYRIFAGNRSLVCASEILTAQADDAINVLSTKAVKTPIFHAR